MLHLLSIYYVLYWAQGIEGMRITSGVSLPNARQSVIVIFHTMLQRMGVH